MRFGMQPAQPQLPPKTLRRVAGPSLAGTMNVDQHRFVRAQRGFTASRFGQIFVVDFQPLTEGR